jgi:hypothetical protein
VHDICKRQRKEVRCRRRISREMTVEIRRRKEYKGKIEEEEKVQGKQNIVKNWEILQGKIIINVILSLNSPWHGAS